MDFNVNRMMQLAGLQVAEENLLSEDNEQEGTQLLSEAAQKEVLVENHIRKMVKEALAEVLKEIEENQQNSSWIYGENKPQNSQKGRVTTGFGGLGFARKQ